MNPFSLKCTTLYLTLHQKPRRGESVTRGYSQRRSSLRDTLPSPRWISNHGHCSVVFSRVSVQLTFTLLLLSTHSYCFNFPADAASYHLLKFKHNKILTRCGWASASHNCRGHRKHLNKKKASRCIRSSMHHQWISSGWHLIFVSMSLKLLDLPHSPFFWIILTFTDGTFALI